MHFMPRRVLAACLVLGVARFTTLPAGAVEVERPYPWSKVTKLLVPGDPAPGFPGDTIFFCGNSQIDGEGNVLFDAGVINPPRLVLYYGSPDNLVPVLQPGDPAPGLPGLTINQHNAQSSLAENGTIGVGASFSGPGIVPGVKDDGLYIGPAGDLQLAFFSGEQPLPDEPGVVIESKDGQHFARFNTLGEFYTQVGLAGPGVTPENKDLLLWGTGDALHPMFREGTPLPELGEGIVLGNADLSSWNDQRQYLFRGRIEGPGVIEETETTWSIWTESGFIHVARDGGAPPVAGIGDFISLLQFPQAFNGFTDVGGTLRMAGPDLDETNDAFVLVGPPGQMTVVAQEGTQVPGEAEGVQFARFNRVHVSPDRNVLFSAEFEGPGTSNVDDALDWSIFWGPAANPTKEISDGVAVMGQPEGVVGSLIGGIASGVAMNRNGYVAGLSDLQGPGVTTANDRLLWMRDGSRSQWFPVLREGDLLLGYPTTFDTAGSLFSQGSAGADGGRQAISASGILGISPELVGPNEGGAFLIEVPLFGDLNEDRVVNGRDIAGFVQVMVNQDILTANELFPADYDVNNLIDEVDLQSFVDALLGVD